MNYKVVVFGVKDTSENIIEFIHKQICPVDLVITIHPEVLRKNQVAGFKGLAALKDKYGIEVHEADSYFLTDEKTVRLMEQNTFDIAVSMGWQRLIPAYVLEKFTYGVYGFHGNCGYLPFGRGRSPLNWSMIEGDSRFNLNLFQYDEKADSPNVFATQMFSITPHDTIRTAQYKNMICSKNLIRMLLKAYQQKEITVRRDSRDFDSWFPKRTANDGKIDFHGRTRNIFNLIRGVSDPFPGAFAYLEECRITIWEAEPFDEIIDFSAYAPGEVIECFDDKPIVRTVDGSLLIHRYEGDKRLEPGMILK